MWLVVSMTLAGSLVAWWVIRNDPVKQADMIKLYYDRFCRKLDKAGMPHRSNEGATEFMARVVKVFPANKQELAMITGDYEHLRYGGIEDEDRVRRYIRAVRRFRVKC